jgi:DNA-binding NarL/FixJ family response regulator
MYRDGLKTLLSSARDLSVVGDAQDGEEAIRLAMELEPHLVLMDLSLPTMSGVEAIAEVKRVLPQTRILAITVHSQEAYITAALKAGADGYILKDADRADVLLAIRTVLSGKSYLAPSVSDTLINRFVRGIENEEEDQDEHVLTRREEEVLKLIARGNTNKAIAEQLFLSVKTVERHRANIMAKLGLHGPQALTAYAIKKGFIRG